MANGRTVPSKWWRRRTPEEQEKWVRAYLDRNPKASYGDIDFVEIYYYFFDRFELTTETIKRY